MNDGQFVKCFGTHNTDTTETAKVIKMHSSWRTLSFQFQCGGDSCSNPNIAAYVYPTDASKRVYLCPYVFSYRTLKREFDAIPGTIIHETSHFDDVIGTGTYAYGYSGSINIAINNPW